MRILYGVVGEGLGHATRSHVVLDHLAKEHEVTVVASKRAYDYLSPRFAEVVEIEGLEFAIDDNALKRKATFASFARLLPTKSLANARSFLAACKQAEPRAVVSDFESFCYAFGKFHDLPVISIDNMQIINRCRVEVPAGYRRDYLLAKAVVKNKLPNCRHYLITSFFFPRVRKPRASLHPPLLRPSVLAAPRREGDHLFVYLTAGSHEALLRLLRERGEPAILYGVNRDAQEGNLTFRTFSEGRFIEDLATCRAVIASAGFSLLSEAIYLGKPYLALPVAKQFEQLLNGHYLTKLGYGESHTRLTGQGLAGFLERLETYRENLAYFEHDNNAGLLARLDTLLAEVG